MEQLVYVLPARLARTTQVQWLPNRSVTKQPVEESSQRLKIITTPYRIITRQHIRRLTQLRTPQLIQRHTQRIQRQVLIQRITTTSTQVLGRVITITPITEATTLTALALMEVILIAALLLIIRTTRATASTGITRLITVTLTQVLDIPPHG